MCFSSLRAAPPDPVSRDEAAQALLEIGNFLGTHMTAPSGAVTVNAVRDRPAIAGEARNDDLLSETVGQMMELALLREDRAGFSRQLGVLRQFAGPSGLPAWKISAGEKAADSATIDDLRIADACFLAAHRWPDLGAEEPARRIAAALAAAAGENLFPPALSLSDGTGRLAVVPLCYLMPGTLARLAREEPRLAPVADEALRLALGDRHRAGLPAQRYDPVNQRWLHGWCDEQLALITLREIQSADPASAEVRAGIDLRLAHFREHGSLPEAFDSLTGEPSGGRGGAAVHANFARLLLADGRTEDAARALRVVLEFQNRTSPFAGAIGPAPVFSFDQLEVLLALADFLRATAKTGKG